MFCINGVVFCSPLSLYLSGVYTFYLFVFFYISLVLSVNVSVKFTPLLSENPFISMSFLNDCWGNTKLQVGHYPGRCTMLSLSTLTSATAAETRMAFWAVGFFSPVPAFVLGGPELTTV